MAKREGMFGIQIRILTGHFPKAYRPHEVNIRITEPGGKSVVTVLSQKDFADMVIEAFNARERVEGEAYVED